MRKLNRKQQRYLVCDFDFCSPVLAPVVQRWIANTNCVIHWIVIYPVDSAIHLLNNWNLNVIVSITINITEIFQVFTLVF